MRLRELENSHVDLETKHEDLQLCFKALMSSHTKLQTTVGSNTLPELQGKTIWSGLSTLSNRATDGLQNKLENFEARCADHIQAEVAAASADSGARITQLGRVVHDSSKNVKAHLANLLWSVALLQSTGRPGAFGRTIPLGSTQTDPSRASPVNLDGLKEVVDGVLVRQH